MKLIVCLALTLMIGFISTAQDTYQSRMCLIDKGILKEVTLDNNNKTGERTIVIQGVRKNFTDVYPEKGPDYAAGTDWFINNTPIQFKERNYIKYGLPRILGATEIVKAGVYKGVGVYTEAGLKGPVEIVYMPVQRGCEFQPYQVNCGTIKIISIAATETTLQLKATTTGLKEKINYDWMVDNAVIITGNGTASVTLDIRSLYDGDFVGVELMAKDAKNCPVTKYESFSLKKKAKKPEPKDWSAGERKAFMDDCIKTSGLAATTAQNYCSCMMEKIIKLYPDIRKAEKELTEEKVGAMTKECMNTGW